MSLNFDGVDYRTPHLAAVAREEASSLSDEYKIKHEGVMEFLDVVFAGGIDLRSVLTRFFTTVNQVAPEKLSYMSEEKLAAIFGQTRAAENARKKMILQELQGKAEYRCLKMPGMRSEETRRKCARAQRGNRNRAKKFKNHD